MYSARKLFHTAVDMEFCLEALKFLTVGRKPQILRTPIRGVRFTSGDRGKAQGQRVQDQLSVEAAATTNPGNGETMRTVKYEEKLTCGATADGWEAEISLSASYGRYAM